MIISGMDTVLLNQDYIKKMNEIMEKENELYNQKDSKTDSSILNKDNTSTVGGKEAGTEEQAKNANQERKDVNPDDVMKFLANNNYFMPITVEAKPILVVVANISRRISVKRPKIIKADIKI